MFPFILDSPPSVQDENAELSPLGRVVDGVPFEEDRQGLEVALGRYPSDDDCRFPGVVVLGDH